MISVVSAVSECNDVNEPFLSNDQVPQPCPATWYTLEVLRMMRMKKKKTRRQKTQKQLQTMLHHHASQPPGKEKRINKFQMGKVSLSSAVLLHCLVEKLKNRILVHPCGPE